MVSWIARFLVMQGMQAPFATFLSNLAAVACMAAASALAYLAAKKVLLRLLKVLVRKSKAKWDDILFRNKVFDRLTLIVPALVMEAFAPSILQLRAWIDRAAACLVVLGIVLALDKLLGAVGDIYQEFDVSRTKPIKGYLQVLKIAVYCIGAIVAVSLLLDRSPALLLGGIGAATAVLLLLFQNTILGFVAGIQLTENDMVRIGDWIEMSKHDADGEVMEISLHTVKVRNWDNTITTIPSYSMVSESFKNWRFMTKSGGRRIKRAVYIDLASVRFCDAEMLERFRKIQYIREYLEHKTAEIRAFNREHAATPDAVANGRHLTNIGTFRAYVEAYLRHQPGIRSDMALLVRQLAPTESGLPIEIYAFTNVTDWDAYEAIQADLFDHILSIVPEFGLRIFQKPTGQDLKTLRSAE